MCKRAYSPTIALKTGLALGRDDRNYKVFMSGRVFRLLMNWFFSRRQPFAVWSDEWLINVARTRSKSICGDPSCSGDPEGEACGSDFRGVSRRPGTHRSCTCTTGPFTFSIFIVFIDWTRGGGGSKSVSWIVQCSGRCTSPTVSRYSVTPSLILTFLLWLRFDWFSSWTEEHDVATTRTLRLETPCTRTSLMRCRRF